MERSRRLLAAGTPLVISIRLAIAFLLISLGSLVVRAQEDRDPPHPAHIHSGSCNDLGDIVYPLTDIALATAGEAFGAASAVPVEESDTTIDASLTDILAAPTPSTFTRAPMPSRITSPVVISAAALSTAS